MSTDNAPLPADGRIIATDLISGVDHQRVKIQHGADGSATDVSTASPLPAYLLGDNLDGVTNAIKTIEYAHHEIHDERTYLAQAFDDSIAATGSGGELVIGFFVPDQPRQPHLTYDFVHEGDMTFKLLEGVTLTLGTGTDVVCVNANRNSSNTSIVQGVGAGSLTSGYVTKNPTYSGGTAMDIIRNYGAKNTPSSGGTREELVFKTNTYYAIVLDNNETTTQGGQIRLSWYEHTPLS